MATVKKSAKVKARISSALNRAKNEAQAAKAKPKQRGVPRPAKVDHVGPPSLTLKFTNTMDWAEVSTLLSEVGRRMGLAQKSPDPLPWSEVVGRLLRGYMAEQEQERRMAEDVALGCILTHGRGALGMLAPQPSMVADLADRFRQGIRPLFLAAAAIYADDANLSKPVDTLTVAERADQPVPTSALMAWQRWTDSRYAEGFQGDADALPREAMANLVALEPHAE